MEKTRLVSLRGLAQALGLPAPWLKTEAEEGRIPSLRIGRRLLFNAGAVQRVLLLRAAGREDRTENSTEEAE
jgi:hypothetical protein